MFKNRPSALVFAVTFALLGMLVGCSKQPSTTGDAHAGIAVSGKKMAVQATASDNLPKPVVSANVQAMSAESLRLAAEKAVSQTRIYAPRGDNAMEYYLALRDKRPDDAATASALTDLMPYTVSAAEQSIARQDFAEAKRLQAMIAKADPSASVLSHLSKSIARGEQQQAEQRDVDQASGTKQPQHAETAKRPSFARSTRSKETKLSEQAKPTTHAAQTPMASTHDRRLLSAPSPRYPVEALRSNISGQVIVEMTIAGTGEVINVRVVQSTPPRIFDRAAVVAVKRWKFEPTGSVSTARRKIEFDPG